MTFKVTILGSSAAMPTAKKHHSAHTLNVYEQFYLVDCGEGTQSRLFEQGINPLKINHIFLSHLHGDHIYGLFPLLATMSMMGRKNAVNIYAPAPFGEIMEDHKRHFDIGHGYTIQWHEVDTRQHQMIMENNVMEVYTIPLRHNVPCAGFLFREKTPPLNVDKWAIEKYRLGIGQIVAAKRGNDVVLDTGEVIANGELTYRPHRPRSYAYCSDTQYSAKVAGIVAGVDLLFHEATFADIDRKTAKQTGHSTTLQAAKVATTAGVGRLIIGHFSSRYKDESALVAETRTLFAESYAATEGKCFEIEAVKE